MISAIRVIYYVKKQMDNFIKLKKLNKKHEDLPMNIFLKFLSTK